MAEIKEVQLGCTVKDWVTGFTGIVIARTEWLNGCNRVTVQPRELKDGKMVDSMTFDVQQLEVIAPPRTEAAPATEEKAPVTGGPFPEPARQADPSR